MDCKDEFNYYAVALIFGKNSPKVSDFQIFKFDTLRKHAEISFSEISKLNVENVLDVERRLLIDEHRTFTTDHCKMSSGVCRVITFVDEKHKIKVWDELFTEREYDYFQKNWDDTIKNKIRTLGMLIRSVYEGKLIDIPLLVNEFEKITSVLLRYPDVWIKPDNK
jgi:hypothetical protein